MGSKNLSEFQRDYEAGQEALERGRYRESVQHLEKALKLVSPLTRYSAEAQILLVTAYQGLGETAAAIALCQKLTAHSVPEIRRQSQEILYILQAPRLQRPPEWLSKIPDLSRVPESDRTYQQGSNPVKSAPRVEAVPVNSRQIDGENRKFIWITLVALLLSLAGLVWLGR
ncbi:MAG: outer membrane protein assembly factor BamD [Chloroflexaceae bacterium]|nr:outer membrane protein assembly factor BamD [Chloroflexaceae bacterium]